MACPPLFAYNCNIYKLIFIPHGDMHLFDFFQNPENHLTVSQTSQKVTVDEPSATSEKKLIFHGALKKVCSDTVEKRVEVQNMVKNSVVDAGSMRQACASDAGTGTNQASSSRGNTDIMEWQGHKVIFKN